MVILSSELRRLGADKLKHRLAPEQAALPCFGNPCQPGLPAPARAPARRKQRRDAAPNAADAASKSLVEPRAAMPPEERTTAGLGVPLRPPPAT